MKKARTFTTLLATMLMIVSLNVVAFAATLSTTAKNYIDTYYGTASFTVAGVSTSQSELQDQGYASIAHFAGSSGTVYWYATDDSVVSAIEAAASSTTNASAELSNVMSEVTVQADTSSALTALSGIIPYVNAFIGFIVIFITLGMAIYTALDICYIAFPIFQENTNSGGGDGKGLMAKAGKLVTSEAKAAVQQTQNGNDGQSPYWYYLKKRIVAYVMLAIVLTLFLTGRMSTITDLAVQAVSGIFDLLG